MSRISAAALAFAATALAPAAAHASDGQWQVKLFASAVLPDGHVLKVSGPMAGVLAGADVRGNDNYVPTLAAEYFLNDTISLETICCATAHHMTGTGTLAGVPLVDHVVIMPFTVTAKYHLNLGPVRPYVGAGPALIVFAAKRPSAAVQALGMTQVSIPAKVAAAVQFGLDAPIGHGFALSADAKYYFDHPTAHFRNASGVDELDTTHELGPWVVSTGIAYRF